MKELQIFTEYHILVLGDLMLNKKNSIIEWCI